MYQVPFGKEALRFTLPAHWRGCEVVSQSRDAVPDLGEAVKEAILRPVGSAPLPDRVKPSDKVCIAFTDITRACPDAALIQPVLACLEERGVPDDHVTLLCAVGMHRASTRAEKIGKLGRQVVDRYRVLDHDARDPGGLAGLGTDDSGVPWAVNRAAQEADLLMATGIVEPHQYAGYSGGAKTVAIGAGGEAFIRHTHGPALLDQPGTRLGEIQGNPFRALVTDLAERAGLNFIINVVQNDRHEVVCVKAGHPVAAFEALVAEARDQYEVPVSRQFDVAIAGVGHPKDANLYQASRAASYLFFAPVPLVKPGGVIIVPAPCGEGAGDGVGERRFLEAMRDAPDMAAILADARRHGYPPGQQRAFIMAQVLSQVRVIIVGPEDPGLIRSARFETAATMADAFHLLQKGMTAPLDVAVVPHALYTLPRVVTDEPGRQGNHDE